MPSVLWLHLYEERCVDVGTPVNQQVSLSHRSLPDTIVLANLSTNRYHLVIVPYHDTIVLANLSTNRYHLVIVPYQSPLPPVGHI